MHVAGQDRQHRADRDQAAEGDGEEPGEGDARAGAGGRRRRRAHRSSAGEVLDHVVGRRRRPPRRRRGSLAPLRTSTVASPAARPPSMSEAIRSPTIATRAGVRRSPPAPSRTGGARACRRSRRRLPEAVSTAARIAPVPGQPPPGIGSVGSRLVRDQRGAARRAPASPSAARRSRSRGGRRRRRRRPRAPPRPRAAAARRRRPSPSAAARRSRRRRRRPGRLGGQPRRDHPGGDDPLGPTSTPSPAQPLGVGSGRCAGLLVTKTISLPASSSAAAPRASPGPARGRPDDPVEVDQKSVESVRQRHRPQAIDSSRDRYRCACASERSNGQVVVATDLHPPLRRGRRRGRRAGRRQHRLRARSLHRDHGPVGLGQVDPDAHPRRARQADLAARSSSTASRSPASTTAS